MQKDSHLLEVCRYVVLNPVRAQIIPYPEDWRWSSYRSTAGLEQPVQCVTIDWVLGQFGRKRSKAEAENVLQDRKKRTKMIVEALQNTGLHRDSSRLFADALFDYQ